MHAKRMLGDVDMFRADVPYEAHPFAAAIPQMTDEQFGNLVEDINRHGLLHPIVLFEGKVLDGRHRLRACCEANVLPKFIEYSGEDPFGYVISQNINRRQLNRGQLALAAARFATLRQGQKSADTAFAVTQGEVAKRFGVSIDTIHRARVVIESGDNNIIEKVNAGSLSVSAAAAGLQRRGRNLRGRPRN